MMNGTKAFQAKFRFNPQLIGHRGVEREMILWRDATPVPEAASVIRVAHARFPMLANHIKPELSACQIETTTRPVRIDHLAEALEEVDSALQNALAELGLTAQYEGIGPADMPLDIYPDGRYERIAATLDQHKRAWACRLIGTHIHEGVTMETALPINNRFARTDWRHLMREADTSGGERIRGYEVVTADFMPRSYADWDRLYQHAATAGFAHDLRRNWALGRLTEHGTFEVRIAGGQSSIARIVELADRYHHACHYGES